MNSFDEVFEHVKRYCLEKGQIPEVAVKLWIDALHPVDLSGTDAVFTIQSDFQRSVILSNYEPLLKEAFRNILGFDINLVIRIEEEFEPEPTQTESTGSEDLALRNQQLEKSFEGANYEYTFSTFIVGRSNEFAYAACTAVAKEPGKSYNPLFIYGPSGLGKTHLMHAIGHYAHELYPDMQVTGLADHYPVPLQKAEIDVPVSWLERRLGKTLTPEDITAKLAPLGFQLTFSGDNMHVVVPTWRSTGDVSIKADIMEEVARMYGYENFEAEPITTSFDGAINQLDKDLERHIKEYLSIRCGMQEIFSYPWMEESYVNAILQSTDGILALSTPPSPSERFIRSSLLPNLCKAVAKNERYYGDFAIFETAQVFHDTDYTTPYDPREKLPSQRKNVAGAFVSAGKDVAALFRKAKGVVEMMPRYTHMERYDFRQVEKPVWADEVVWLNIYLGEERIGDLALLSKRVSMACGIKNVNVMLFQLDQDALVPLRSRTNTFTHLAEYPMTDYDISLLLDGEVKWADVAETIEGVKNPLLHGASFVDEYRGKQVPAGKKSLTARLTIGSTEKTLTSAEIEEVANSVLKKLSKRFGAELRSR